MVSLCFSRSAKEHLARHLHQLEYDDVEFVIKSANLIRPPAESEIYIALPMHFEERSLWRYLAIVAPQAKAHKAAIIVFFNASALDPRACFYDDFLRDAKETISRARESFAYDRLFLVDLLCNGPTTMGRIRGLICDIIVVNAIGASLTNPIVICNDVDTLRVSDDYLSSYREIFEGDSNTKMSAGVVHYGYIEGRAIGLPQGVHIPELFLFNKINQTINYCARIGKINFERRIFPEGANMAFACSAYCSVGGFDFLLNSGEDDALGKALHRYNPNCFAHSRFQADVIYREDEQVSCCFNDRGWIVTDPRRILNAIDRGATGIEAWADQPFMENPGAHLQTEALTSRYLNNPKTIKLASLICANRSDEASLRHIILSKITEIIDRSIQFVGIVQTPDQVDAVLEELGWQSSHTQGSAPTKCVLTWQSCLVQQMLNLECAAHGHEDP